MQWIKQSNNGGGGSGKRSDARTEKDKRKSKCTWNKTHGADDTSAHSNLWVTGKKQFDSMLRPRNAPCGREERGCVRFYFPPPCRNAANTNKKLYSDATRTRSSWKEKLSIVRLRIITEQIIQKFKKILKKYRIHIQTNHGHIIINLRVSSTTKYKNDHGIL